MSSAIQNFTFYTPSNMYLNINDKNNGLFTSCSVLLKFSRRWLTLELYLKDFYISWILEISYVITFRGDLDLDGSDRWQEY